MRVYKLSKDTTLGELENLLSTLFQEVENSYKNPEQCVGKITIRAEKENGEIAFLGIRNFVERGKQLSKKNI